MEFFIYFLASFLIVATTSNAYRPIEYNFISTFDTNGTDISYRLPNNTKPEAYSISLITNVDKNDFNFTGRVKIKLNVLETSNSITLHARQLTIVPPVELMNIHTIESIEISDFKHDVTTEFLTIPAQLIKNEEYMLTISYVGELRSDMGGFYKSSYVNSNGERKWLATTQFESTDARHAFPCYDEPALKAIFYIDITHGESYNAISNMKETRGTPKNGMVTTKFAPTKLTSTYLLAFIVSDFEYTESNATATNPTAQRVFTSKHNINQTSYPLNEGVAILNAIGNYLQVPFSLPKMDQVAIPDFRAGAMENWGLVTYREEYLLYDPSIHLPSRQLSITTIIAHEFGHQWFGNLVSPKWWTYIWLNEGFATLFEAVATDLVHPEWNIWSYYVASKVQPVLRVDAKPKSRPMTYYTESPTGVAGLFDNIAYAKAGSVIRMFMHALGEQTFKKGLNYYLTNNSYNVAEENDLFAALNAAAKEDKALPDNVNVKDLFGSWSNQKGFPLLNVTRDYDSNTVTLSQSKYDVPKANKTDPSTWWIPYNFATSTKSEYNVTKPSGWLQMEEREQVIQSDENTTAFTKDDWLLFNIQQSGYYRVLYDDKNYELIYTELNGGDINKIHPLNRAQVLDDLQEFVYNGVVSPKILCETMSYLTKETEYAPWAAAKRAISEWNQFLQASGKLNQYKKIIAGLLEPYYKSVTLIEKDGEQILDKLTRNIAVGLACEYGVKECLDDTYTKFKEILSGNKTSQNIRGLVIANGIRKANSDEINQLWEHLLNNTSSDERAEILSSLGNIQDKEHISINLLRSIENFGEKNLTATERSKIILTIINGGKVGVEAAIEFLSDWQEEVVANGVSLPNMLASLAEKILTDDMKVQMDKILETARNGSRISEPESKAIEEIVTETLDWQKAHLTHFENEFFTGKCSGAVPLVAMPIFVFILFCLTRWNWL